MLKDCAAYGITPLTRAEFEEEDRRIYMALVKRRTLGTSADQFRDGYYCTT